MFMLTDRKFFSYVLISCRRQYHEHFVMLFATKKALYLVLRNSMEHINYSYVDIFLRLFQNQ